MDIGVDSFPFVVVEHRPLVSPWLHTRAGKRLTEGKFVCGARDDDVVKAALVAGDSCIVWQGASADEMNRALVSHRAAWAMFNRDHAWVMSRLLPCADPLHAVLADVTRTDIVTALQAFPDDEELLDGLYGWAVACREPEATGFRRETGDGISSWLWAISLGERYDGTRVAHAELLKTAAQALEMMEFVERSTPNSFGEHIAVYKACGAGVPVEEFCQVVDAALGVVPTFVVDGVAITELLETMFPQRWMRWYIEMLAKDAATAQAHAA